MLLDFGVLKNRVNEVSFDHTLINDWIGKGINPTAENMVLVLKHKLDELWLPSEPTIRRIRIWETPDSWAERVWDVKIEKIRTSLAESVKQLQGINKYIKEEKK